MGSNLHDHMFRDNVNSEEPRIHRHASAEGAAPKVETGDVNRTTSREEHLANVTVNLSSQHVTQTCETSGFGTTVEPNELTHVEIDAQEVKSPRSDRPLTYKAALVKNTSKEIVDEDCSSIHTKNSVPSKRSSKNATMVDELLA